MSIICNDEVEEIRHGWCGKFLLDLPQQVLRIRKGRKVEELQLGRGDLHWDIAKVLSAMLQRGPDIKQRCRSFRGQRLS